MNISRCRLRIGCLKRAAQVVDASMNRQAMNSEWEWYHKRELATRKNMKSSSPGFENYSAFARNIRHVINSDARQFTHPKICAAHFFVFSCSFRPVCVRNGSSVVPWRAWNVLTSYATCNLIQNFNWQTQFLRPDNLVRGCVISVALAHTEKQEKV